MYFVMLHNKSYKNVLLIIPILVILVTGLLFFSQFIFALCVYLSLYPATMIGIAHYPNILGWGGEW